MYTELILGCALKENTPQEIINSIKFMLIPNNDGVELPLNFPDRDNKESRIRWMFNSGGSYYFGANSGQYYFEKDSLNERYRFLVERTGDDPVFSA